MSVIIHDLDIPISCAVCPCFRFGRCAAIKKHKAVDGYFSERPEWCPMREYDDMENYFPRRCQRIYTEEEIKEIEELMMEDWSS